MNPAASDIFVGQPIGELEQQQPDQDGLGACPKTAPTFPQLSQHQAMPGELNRSAWGAVHVSPRTVSLRPDFYAFAGDPMPRVSWK